MDDTTGSLVPPDTKSSSLATFEANEWPETETSSESGESSFDRNGYMDSEESGFTTSENDSSGDESSSSSDSVERYEQYLSKYKKYLDETKNEDTTMTPSEGGDRQGEKNETKNEDSTTTPSESGDRQGENYEKYRKSFASAKDEKDRWVTPEKKLGAAPALEITYRYSTPDPPPTNNKPQQQQETTKPKSSKLKSYVLGKEDLAIVNMMLVGADSDSDMDSLPSTQLNEHIFADTPSSGGSANNNDVDDDDVDGIISGVVEKELVAMGVVEKELIAMGNEPDNQEVTDYSSPEKNETDDIPKMVEREFAERLNEEDSRLVESTKKDESVSSKPRTSPVPIVDGEENFGDILDADKRKEKTNTANDSLGGSFDSLWEMSGEDDSSSDVRRAKVSRDDSIGMATSTQDEQQQQLQEQYAQKQSPASSPYVLIDSSTSSDDQEQQPTEQKAQAEEHYGNDTTESVALSSSAVDNAKQHLTDQQVPSGRISTNGDSDNDTSSSSASGGGKGTSDYDDSFSAYSVSASQEFDELVADELDNPEYEPQRKKYSEDQEIKDSTRIQAPLDSDQPSRDIEAALIPSAQHNKKPSHENVGILRYSARGLILIVGFAISCAPLYLLFARSDEADEMVPPPTVQPATLPSAQPTLPPIYAVSPTATPLRESFISMWPSLEEDFANPLSPQYLAFQWLSNNGNLNYFSDEKKMQRFVLATFYFSTNGDHWKKKDSWLTEEDECNWYSSNIYRSQCNELGYYRNLELNVNGLSGTIPSELALLSDSLILIDLMQDEDASDQVITGQMPSELGALTLLESISLGENELSGRIPSEIGNWSRASFLDLKNNNLIDEIPSEIGLLVALSSLNLENNHLSVIPSEIGNLRLLRDLDLARNEFGGSIPKEIGNLVVLTSLDLGNNLIIGTIPTELAGAILLSKSFISGQAIHAIQNA
jgi:hypothetical protein